MGLLLVRCTRQHANARSKCNHDAIHQELPSLLQTLWNRRHKYPLSSFEKGGVLSIGCKAISYERRTMKCELYDGIGNLVSWYGHDVGFLRRDDDDDDDDRTFAVSK